MTGRRAALLSLTLVLTIAPSIAVADAGTPLIWGTMFHLLVGNLLIGLFEALLLVRLFGAARTGNAMSTIVAGNYFSCGVGLVLFAFTPVAAWMNHLVGADRSFLLHAKAAVIVVGVTTWLVSVVVEAPFVWLVLPARRRNLRHVLLASLTAQSASYVILGACCLGVSDFSLYQYAHVRGDTAFAGDAWRIYFRNEEDGFIWSARIDGGERRRESDAPIPVTATLLLQGSSGTGSMWRIGDGQTSVPTRIPVDRFHWPRSAMYEPDPYRLVDLGRNDSQSRYHPDVWGGFLLDGERYDLGTIAGTMSPERLLVLPDGRAVMSTVGGEIDVIDPKPMTVGFLTSGRSPVVVPESP